MAKYTFLERLKTNDYGLIKSATCWGMPGLTWEKMTPTRTDQKE